MAPPLPPGRLVEVHPEAGHRVVSTGPYAVVRHPMYAGYIVWLLAVPVALEYAAGVRWRLLPRVF